MPDPLEGYQPRDLIKILKAQDKDIVAARRRKSQFLPGLVTSFQHTVEVTSKKIGAVTVGRFLGRWEQRRRQRP